MKIALVCPHFEHAHTGETSSMSALRECLTRRGHTVRSVIPPLGPALGGEEKPWSKYRRIVSILSGLRNDPDPPDVYHIHLPTPALAWMISTPLSRPVVVTFEGLLVGEEWRYLVRTFAAAPLYVAPRLVLNNSLFARLRVRADRIVVPTEHQRRELLSCGYRADDVQAIPNIVRQPFIDFTASRDECVNMLGLDPSRRYCTYLGHFLPSKGVEDLLEAFGGLCAAIPDLDLVLAWSGVGKGARIEEEIISRGLCHRIHVLGAVDPKVVFRASALSVFPYRTMHGHAMIPSAVMESAAIGTPTLVPEHSAFDELRSALVLYRPHSACDVASKIGEILADAACTKRFRERGMELFSGELAPERLAARYERLYHDVVGSR